MIYNQTYKNRHQSYTTNHCQPRRHWRSWKVNISWQCCGPREEALQTTWERESVTQGEHLQSLAYTTAQTQNFNKIFNSNIKSVLLYGSETWFLTTRHENNLQSWKPKDIVRSLCEHISLEIYVRTMTAQCPHNISLVRHISFERCCADIVRTLCGHISPRIYVRTISSFGFHLRYSGLVFNFV